MLFHEVSESTHRFMNPLSDAKLDLLGEICRLGPEARVLDLASGKGELLCRWAARHDCGGLGVELHPGFVRTSIERAEELGVSGRVEFEQADAAGFESDRRFDVAMCIGASWIGGGPLGTVELLRRFAQPGCLFLLGEVFWNQVPPIGNVDLLDPDGQVLPLAGTVDLLEGAGAQVVEMVLADCDDWDRYQASQWRNVSDWLASNAAHAQADEIRATNRRWKRAYLDYGRDRWGWGIFVLR